MDLSEMQYLLSGFFPFKLDGQAARVQSTMIGPAQFFCQHHS